MAVGWFLAQYEADAVRPERRRCTIERFRDTILADGGKYGYREVLGNQAVVGIAGVTAATLNTINGDPVVRRFPGVNNLTDNLGALTAQQWANYRSFALSLGYPASEWDARFPLDKSSYTLRDVIQFALRRRVTPRFDAPTQAIILDGSVVNIDPAEADSINTEIQ